MGKNKQDAPVYRADPEKKEALKARATKEGKSVQKFIDDLVDLPLKCSAIELAAEKAGMPISDFLKEAGNFWAQTSHEAIPETLKIMSGTFGLNWGMIVQNLLIKYTAERAAFFEVFGMYPPVPEFEITADGVQTGDALFEKLRAQYTANLENIKQKYLERRQKKDQAGAIPFEVPLLNRAMERVANN